MGYMALDFETTGLDPLKHVPLTLGFAWDSGRNDVLSTEFHFSFKDMISQKWDVEAMYINKIDLTDRPRENFATAYDWQLCKFLMDCGSPFDKDIIPVGWNVGGFDMRFMQTFFPQASKFFSHKYVELNTLLRAAQYAGIILSKEDLKEEAEVRGKEKNKKVKWHNAEWDAIASFYAFSEIRNALMSLDR